MANEETLRLHLSPLQAELLLSILMESPIPGKYSAVIADLIEKINGLKTSEQPKDEQ